MSTTLSPTEAPPQRPHLKARVLIVDDEPVLRAMASTILATFGCEVMNVSSAEEAVELMTFCAGNRKLIDVVILDLVLPGGQSGMEAVRRLQQIHPEVRMIASSGFFAGAESQSSCLDLGFHDILPKPYTAGDLAAIVERNLRATYAYRTADAGCEDEAVLCPA
ncbi:MAG: response regulator [Roseimicrobium sp.]